MEIIRMVRFVNAGGNTVHVRAVGTALEFDALSRALEAAVDAGLLQTSCFPEGVDESRPLRTVEYMRERLDEMANDEADLRICI